MKHIHLLLLTITVYIFISCQPAKNNAVEVNIDIDLLNVVGPVNNAWAMFGYDEPNYTYMKDGQSLLSKLSDLSPVPVYVRAHSLLVTGDGTPALKWGSTNAYTEDNNGDPVYNWNIIDSIFDTYVDRGMKPLVEIGFMPKALSVKPEPYKHKWRPGAPYNDIYTGWAYPPNDYEKWADLVYAWVKHSIERYGKAEVETWYWELWNEPNIGYWQGSTEEYLMLYDYTADAVKRALPTAVMGGPHSTGPSWDKAERFLRDFLNHTSKGTNYKTGKIGSPVDFIAFHAKGAPRLINDTIRMNMGTQLRDVSKGFEVVSSYPEYKQTPIIIGECDPEGCAACSMKDYPANAYRNGTMYSSYTAASFSRIYQLMDHYDVNLRGIVTWAFEFENQPWFNGYRDLATNDVDKPVLNVFRMFGMMQGNRVAVSGDLAYDFKLVRDSSVRGDKRDINAMASINDSMATVMIWNYHDMNIISPSSLVAVNLSNIPARKAKLIQYMIDQEHSNAYETWKEMGSPQNPTQEQINTLKKAGMLQQMTDQRNVSVKQGKLTLPLKLSGQAVSLLVLKW